MTPLPRHRLMDGQPAPPADPFRLDGRVAVITGAARGIGYATALRMLEAGASVAINDIDGQALDIAVEDLGGAGPRVLPVVADVSDISAHERIVRQVMDELGSLDILVNNAGSFEPSSLDRLDPDLVDKQLALNVKGLVFLSSACAQAMKPGSTIVNLSSLGGVRPPFTGLAAYHATKGAVDSLTRDMALEWGPRGIRVNGAGPGGILTEGGGQVSEDPLYSVEVMDEIRRRATARPLGRMGYADDLAMAIVFLASPAAGFVTGQQLLVDGGYYLA
jgi:NAD(P)-dependent dehydrogenase (short-subunit alcohol dehydrogenase family)